MMMAQALIAQDRLFTNEQHFTVEDGLPQNFIGGILQDEDANPKDRHHNFNS